MRVVGASTAILVSAALSATAEAQTFAGWLNEIDFDRLASEYAGTQANGSNVNVTIVETEDSDVPGLNYYPDITDARFAGKTMTARTGSYSVASGHATRVGAFFFGSPPGFSQRSVAPGISNVDMYTFQWESAFFLSPGTPPPLMSPNQSRVASHAYGSTATLNVLRRIDWVVENDDFLQVVGSQSVSNHGNGFNSIAVAPTAGISGVALNGTAAVGTGNPYVAGRYRPDVTGPHGTTSDSIGAVAGVTALLVSRGKADASLSDHSYVARPGYTVRSAETSEVVKAALMAGALRHTTGNSFIGNISNYRTDAANRTANGLDKRYGAGMVNVYNSYKIIDAGEQASVEDAVTSPTAGHIGEYGFDYDDSFGGAGGSNAASSYRFATVAGGGTLTATLAWNLNVAFTSGSFDANATPLLHAMELALFDVTNGTPTLVASSSSAIDNTQSIWQSLAGDREYLMQVRPLSGQGAFDWDYGLAWRIDGWEAAAVPEPAGVLALLAALPLLLRRSRGG